jgi:hypothetical protein
VQKTAKNAREKRRMPSKNIKKRPSHRFFSAEGEFVRFLRYLYAEKRIIGGYFAMDVYSKQIKTARD